VPEFARAYLSGLGRPYREEDLDAILRGQLDTENKALASSKGGLVVCDTGPEVIWVWSTYKFGRVSSYMEKMVRNRVYRRTLLMDIDLPWSPDPLRENPSLNERRELLSMYRSLLDRVGRSYRFVSGEGRKRLRRAIEAIREDGGTGSNRFE